MLFVGIDFSISSPAYCISSEDDVLVWGSVSRTDRSEESLKKNRIKPYYILGESDLFSLYFLEKKDLPSDYSERERIKIKYFLEVVDSLWNSILDFVGDREFTVAMEGLSFASNGNALIDISMATALLRERIVDVVGVDRFFVFSPTSIKKFALKGNAKKNELYVSLYESEQSGKNMVEFQRILRENSQEWITGSGNVNKPVDDLVDATWISLYLKNQQYGGK